MNQEEPVQVLKQKHPGRVAAGKKLAESNRKRKQEMLKLVQVAAQEPSQVLTQEPSQVLTKEPASSFNLYTTGAGVIILVIGCAYTGYMFYTSRVRRASAENSKAPATAELKPSKPRRRML